MAVLSRSLDLSTSEDDSSYLEPGNLKLPPERPQKCCCLCCCSGSWVTPPKKNLSAVIPEEVKPKFVKGKKRYGRRSRPDKPESALSQGSEDFGPSGVESSDLSPSGIRRAKLRRSTSLESIEVRYPPFSLVFLPFKEDNLWQIGGGISPFLLILDSLSLPQETFDITTQRNKSVLKPSPARCWARSLQNHAELKWFQLCHWFYQNTPF